MKYLNSNRFVVKLRYENNYHRVHITHPSFKGRIRKRLGNHTAIEADNIALNIRYELGREFENKEITEQAVEAFITNYISMKVKMNASMFEYVDEFLNYKVNSFNKKTKKNLSKSTLSGYRTALKYFEEYFNKHRIKPHPSNINEETLNGFYNYCSGSHNYRVKIHNKIKNFIKFLRDNKNITIDHRYKLSVYNEEYDNQSPSEDDIALTDSDVKKLITLRKKILTGEIKLKTDSFSDKIPVELQMINKNIFERNFIKSLDCFLFMVATGQYWSDIMKTKLFFSNNNGASHIRYRRAKNGSLCKAIPILNDDFFIGGEIIKQYGIKNNSNFPLNLSLTHFDLHLHRISLLAGIGHKITNKMARKTFASELYFNRNLRIHYVQILLGHKDVRDTTHYLRISDNDLANEIKTLIS